MKRVDFSVTSQAHRRSAHEARRMSQLDALACSHYASLLETNAFSTAENQILAPRHVVRLYGGHVLLRRPVTTR